jgi:uncharacterized protein (TIGR02001 family)
MKKSLSLVLGSAGLTLVGLGATPASAQIAGLSGNAAVTTNYIFRGISQSGGKPAVQAGVDYAVPGTGLALGTWASSIDFGSIDGAEAAPLEWDIYGSYTFAITDALGVSAGAIAYVYPNPASGANFNWYEGWVGLSYNFGVASLNGRVYYSPDYVYLSTGQIYFTGGVSVPVLPWLTLNGNVGFSTFDHAVDPANDIYIIEDYMDWNLSAVASYGNFSLTVGYTDTDLGGNYEIDSGPFKTTAQLFLMVGFRLPAP